MTGDQFNVHYCLFSDLTNTRTEPNGPWNRWADAKAFRDATFHNSPDVQSCWVMVTNPSLGLQPKKYGHTLRRERDRLKYDSDIGGYYTSRQRRGQRKRREARV